MEEIMKKKYTWAVAAFCVQLGVANAATIYVENFTTLDPATDTNGPSSTILGGQGQLEDITGTTWSGPNTDTGNLQTRVTTNQTLTLYTQKDATMPQINTSAVFTPQNQSSIFGFYFNLKKWGTDNAGAGHVKAGRAEIGVRDSTTNTNVFGIEIMSTYNKKTQVHTYLWDYRSGTRIRLLDTSNVTVAGGSVGSIGFSYDGANNITLNVYAEEDKGGAILQTVTTNLSSSAFSADSFYVKASQAVTAGNVDRILRIEVDDLTLTASDGSTTPTPVITDITVSGGVVSVTATNLSLTANYILIRTDDLTGTFTNEIAGSEITPTNQMSVLQDSAPLEGEAFYKVQSKE